MLFDVDSKFDLDSVVVDKNGKNATVVDAKLNYSPTTFSYKVSYLVEYNNMERLWKDENVLTISSTSAI